MRCMSCDCEIQEGERGRRCYSCRRERRRSYYLANREREQANMAVYYEKNKVALTELNKKYRWNIDHIIPQSDFVFDSISHSNFKKCWALKNLRPLSAKQNFIRGCSLRSKL